MIEFYKHLLNSIIKQQEIDRMNIQTTENYGDYLYRVDRVSFLYGYTQWLQISEEMVEKENTPFLGKG